MQMQVCEGVVLVNPIGDGQDYHTGMEIELPAEVARDWERRGWVRPAAGLKEGTDGSAE